MHAVDTVDCSGEGQDPEGPPPPGAQSAVCPADRAAWPPARGGWCRNWAPGSDHRLSEAALSAVQEKPFRRLSQKPNNIPRKHRVTEQLQPGVQRPGRGRAGQGTAGEQSCALAVVPGAQDLGTGAQHLSAAPARGPPGGEGHPRGAQTPPLQEDQPCWRPEERRQDAVDRGMRRAIQKGKGACGGSLDTLQAQGRVTWLFKSSNRTKKKFLSRLTS